MPASNRKKSLSFGRPGVTKPTRAKLSAKAGRTIIRSHHQLNKALQAALDAGDTAKVDAIRKQIEKKGGLSSYQHASLLGQSDERGGDSSKVLVDWMKSRTKDDTWTIRVLEVGALSTANACSRWKRMVVTRIDLNSQQAGITQQDFMERPLPVSKDDKFDVISLSLVLNYVPSKEGRGQMLLRTRAFLDEDVDMAAKAHCPCLFLVLPAPCIMNSRYLTEKHLDDIMAALGYEMLEQKITSKLHYSLWELHSPPGDKHIVFKRQELNPGRTRNNFSIVVE